MKRVPTKHPSRKTQARKDTEAARAVVRRVCGCYDIVEEPELSLIDEIVKLMQTARSTK